MTLACAAFSAARADDSEQRHRLRHAFEVMAAALLDDEETGDLTLHPRCHNDRTRLGQTLRSRRDVRYVAEYLACRIDHHRPSVDSDTRGKRGLAGTRVFAVQLGEPALNSQRRPHRPLGIVLLRQRVAEQRHQPVAELLGNMAAHFRHRRGCGIEIGADEVAPLLGIEPRRNAGRIHQIAEHRRDMPALAGGFQGGRVGRRRRSRPRCRC
jgi:hypothetical protein